MKLIIFIKTNCLFSLFFVLMISSFANSSARYYSQINVWQDRYLNEHLFFDKKGGFFVDIGAHDGVTHSNSYFFEKELGWSGICFEPLSNVFLDLSKNRNCTCINACVSANEGMVDFIEAPRSPDVPNGMVKEYPEMLSGLANTYDSRHLQRMESEVRPFGGKHKVIQVQSYRFNDVMKRYGVKNIDYLSIDTEGSELQILESIDFDSVKITAMSVENNYNDPSIKKLLESKNFVMVCVLGGQDEIYINKDYINLLKR